MIRVRCAIDVLLTCYGCAVYILTLTTYAINIYLCNQSLNSNPNILMQQHMCIIYHTPRNIRATSIRTIP